MSLGNTSLALLTALLAVGGVALPTLHQLIRPIQIGYLGVTDDERLLLSAVNRTDHPLWIRRITLEAPCLADERAKLRLWDPGGGPRAADEGTGPGAYTPSSNYSVPPGSAVLLVRPETLNLSRDAAGCREDLRVRVELMSGRRIKAPVKFDEDVLRFLDEWGDEEPGGAT